MVFIDLTRRYFHLLHHHLGGQARTHLTFLSQLLYPQPFILDAVQLRNFTQWRHVLLALIVFILLALVLRIVVLTAVIWSWHTQVILLFNCLLVLSFYRQLLCSQLSLSDLLHHDNLNLLILLLLCIQCLVDRLKLALQLRVILQTAAHDPLNHSLVAFDLELLVCGL